MLYKLVTIGALAAASVGYAASVPVSSPSVDAAAPTGTYKGGKTALGETLNAMVVIGDTTHMDLTLSGALSVACKQEAFSFDGTSAVTLPGLNAAGDCVHDALAAAPLPVSIKSIAYSGSSDNIEITAKVSFLTLTLTLTKSTALTSVPATTVSAAERAHWWDDFKAHHGRTYVGDEDKRRFAIFEETLVTIAKRNLDGSLGSHFVNEFADLSHEEFRATHMGYKPKATTHGQQELALPLSTRVTTASVDWRSHSPSVLTPVKNQGHCGSCWAFSATEQIETDVALSTGHLYTLSPQQITSCDTSDGGCNGGNTETAYKYVEKAGLEAETSYPYTSGTTTKSGTCEYSSSKSVVSISGYSTVSSCFLGICSEGKMLTQIAKSPMSVCVDAETWQTYSSGVVGASCGTSLDHCVQAVGYNAEEGYWIVRNSWGTSWGQNGFIYVKEGSNACGIAKDVTIVSGATNQPAAVTTIF